MRDHVVKSFSLLVCSVVVAAFLAAPAFAFDPDKGMSKDAKPADLFRFGFSAYKNGHKNQAMEAYKSAAEMGHAGARWALASMYAAGDGVTENDYEAFKIYDEIARKGVEPGSADTGYFVNALLALASYYMHGIPRSPVHEDLEQARQLYFHVASVFGVPDAEYELGKMMLSGEGGADNIAQAKKWLNKARKGGNQRAAALLGNVLFQQGQIVYGLAMMTAALQQARDKDKDEIRDMQEQAFSLASETDRRRAVLLSQGMLASNTN